MATIPLTITIPDTQISRVQAALRTEFGQVPDGSGGFRDMTNAELVARLKEDIILLIKGVVLRQEKQTQLRALETFDPLIDAT